MAGNRTEAVKRAWETRRGEKPPVKEERGSKDRQPGEAEEWAEGRTGKKAMGSAGARAPADPKKSKAGVAKAGGKFEAHVAGARAEAVKTISDGKGGESANLVHLATLNGKKVIAKPAAPKTKSSHGFDPKEAVVLHNAMHKSAEDMGLGHLLMPVAVVEARGLGPTRDGTPTFVTEHAGDSMKPIYKVSPQEVAAKVPNEERVGSAVLDFLHSNTDRHGKNAMFDGKRMVLIDHDLTHGRTVGDKVRSVFFPGGHAAYSGKQAKLADLPPRVRAAVEGVAKGSDAEVASAHGISSAEARLMKQRAQAIVDGGLDKAIKQAGAWGWTFDRAVKVAMADMRAAQKAKKGG